MQPKPIAEMVKAALPLLKVRCARTAAIPAGMVAADTDDLPVMAFSAAVTFSNAGAMQMAAPCQCGSFQEPATTDAVLLNLFFFHVVICLIIFLIAKLDRGIKSLCINFTDRITNFNGPVRTMPVYQ